MANTWDENESKSQGMRANLVPRPHHQKISGLVFTLCASVRISGTGSVNISVNGLSHMLRSSTETVYGIVKQKNGFLRLK